MNATINTISTQDFLSQAEPWFLTGKKEYTIQGMMVSRDTAFHNPLEDVDYTAKDDGVAVVLKGTIGEQWIAKLPKVIKTYTKEDGTPLTAEDFAQKDKFINLKTKTEPNTNFAVHVPVGTVVEVKTSWGDTLISNAPGIPHGEGDYLVCSKGPDGKPDLSDIWTVNGAIFPSTYQF